MKLMPLTINIEDLLHKQKKIANAFLVFAVLTKEQNAKQVFVDTLSYLIYILICNYKMVTLQMLIAFKAIKIPKRQ